MANNIFKRQPVMHKLPAGWDDYDAIKYNVLDNIKGLQQYDNPTINVQNSTYNCKNVYQDNAGSLTVRPSLRYKSFVTNRSNTEVLHIYRTSLGEIWHIKSNGVYSMETDTAVLNIGEGNICVEESDGRVYVLYTSLEGKLSFNEYNGDDFIEVDPDIPANVKDNLSSRLYNILSDKTKYLTIEPVDGVYKAYSVLKSVAVNPDTRPDYGYRMLLKNGSVLFTDAAGNLRIYTDLNSNPRELCRMYIGDMPHDQFAHCKTSSTLVNSLYIADNNDSLSITHVSGHTVYYEQPNYPDGLNYYRYTIDLSSGKITQVASKYLPLYRSGSTNQANAFCALDRGVAVLLLFRDSNDTATNYGDDIWREELSIYNESKFIDIDITTGGIEKSVRTSLVIKNYALGVDTPYFGNIVAAPGGTGEFIIITTYHPDSTDLEDIRDAEQYIEYDRTADYLHYRDDMYLDTKIYARSTGLYRISQNKVTGQFALEKLIKSPNVGFLFADILYFDGSMQFIADTYAVIKRDDILTVGTFTTPPVKTEYSFNENVLLANSDTTVILTSTNLLYRTKALESVYIPRLITDAVPLLSEISDECVTSFYLDNIHWFVTKHRVFGTGVANEQFSIKYFDPMKYFQFDEVITAAIRISDSSFWVFHNNGAYLIYKSVSTIYDATINEYAETITWLCTNTAKSKGCDFENAVMTLPVSSYVATVTSDDISYIQMRENVQTDERILVPMTLDFSKFVTNLLNTTSDVVTGVYKYHALFFMNPAKISGKVPVLVYSAITESWWYWEFPVNRVVQTITTETNLDILCECGGYNWYDLYSDYYDYTLGGLTYKIYADRLGQYAPTRIEWFWESPLLHFNNIEYKKQLLFTRFNLSESDNYEVAFEYNFAVYDNEALTADWTEVESAVEKAQSHSVRSTIAHFRYLQLYLRNKQDDENYNTYTKPKFNSISFKYRLLWLAGGTV